LPGSPGEPSKPKPPTEIGGWSPNISEELRRRAIAPRRRRTVWAYIGPARGHCQHPAGEFLPAPLFPDMVAPAGNSKGSGREPEAGQAAVRTPRRRTPATFVGRSFRSGASRGTGTCRGRGGRRSREGARHANAAYKGRPGSLERDRGQGGRLARNRPQRGQRTLNQVKLRRPRRAGSVPATIDLGNEPPLSVDGATSIG